jgi:hypothetical protein
MSTEPPADAPPPTTGSRLTVTSGNVEGATLRVRVHGGQHDITGKRGQLAHGQIATWTAVEIIATARRGGAATVRYWRIVPGPTANRIAEGPLEVVGAFAVDVQRSGKAANEAWDAR